MLGTALLGFGIMVGIFAVPLLLVSPVDTWWQVHRFRRQLARMPTRMPD